MAVFHRGELGVFEEGVFENTTSRIPRDLVSKMLFYSNRWCFWGGIFQISNRLKFRGSNYWKSFAQPTVITQSCITQSLVQNGGHV